MTLPEIYDDYRSDPAFDHLRSEHIVLVPGEGSSRPAVMIVGEAPGATENTAKRPFVGASGLVLRSLMVDAAQLEPRHWFITNTVKYRPPGNRTPEPREIAASLPYLRREYVALGSPAVIVAVGGTAWAAFRPPSAPRAGAMLVAGTPIALPGGKALWPMLHPAYGLRNSNARPKMEEHWTSLGHWLREEGLL